MLKSGLAEQDRRYLYNYMHFGRFSRTTAVEVLAAQFDEYIAMGSEVKSELNEPSPNQKGKLLAIKIYAEFFAAMEDLGALCLAIRDRKKTGFLCKLLTYHNKQIADFYRIFGKQTFESGLRLPRAEKLSDKALGMPPTVLRQSYEVCTQHMRQVAVMFNDQTELRKAFNKSKHGFTMVDDQNLLRPGTDEVIELDQARALIWDSQSEDHEGCAAGQPVLIPFGDARGLVVKARENVAILQGTIGEVCLTLLILADRQLI